MGGILEIGALAPAGFSARSWDASLAPAPTSSRQWPHGRERVAEGAQTPRARAARPLGGGGASATERARLLPLPLGRACAAGGGHRDDSLQPEEAAAAGRHAPDDGPVPRPPTRPLPMRPRPPPRQCFVFADGTAVPGGGLTAYRLGAAGAAAVSSTPPLRGAAEGADSEGDQAFGCSEDRGGSSLSARTGGSLSAQTAGGRAPWAAVAPPPPAPQRGRGAPLPGEWEAAPPGGARAAARRGDPSPPASAVAASEASAPSPAAVRPRARARQPRTPASSSPSPTCARWPPGRLEAPMPQACCASAGTAAAPVTAGSASPPGQRRGPPRRRGGRRDAGTDGPQDAPRGCGSETLACRAFQGQPAVELLAGELRRGRPVAEPLAG
ncbi:unnamed protein product [Prorocentrum cordatum]|uniref:Uncharacterized protein n=1 Tax=Prorocentrum cordatum TaxID=2364126 RepID=A0ABN9SRG5_9DINO|nr:unnamed protein product [Polarella glacialis]